MNLLDLENKMDDFNKTAERRRYSKQERPGRSTKSIYEGFRMEKIIVPHHIWKLFSDESDRRYYGGHGSRNLWVVYFREEELAKFTRRTRAQDYIWEKVGYKSTRKDV